MQTYKEKLQNLKNNIFKLTQRQKELPSISNNSTSLTNLDDNLELLLNEDFSFLELPESYVKDVVRLTIILDVSGSMIGTEEDIVFGLKNLI